MGETLVKTLESVCNQTFSNVEHIVVDAQSSDNTLDLLREYQSRYSLNWISEPDHGVPDAFNKAIKMSSGKYIIAIQADDYLLNNDVLENVFQIIQDMDTEYDVLSFPIIKGYPGKKDRLIKSSKKIWWLRFRNIFPHQGIFINRRLFDRIGLYNLEYTITEDYDFFYRAINEGCLIHFADEPLVAYMGGEGACSVDEYLPVRLKEERKLQQRNEKSPVWRLLQRLFWLLYWPYKTKIRGSC